MTEPKKRPLGRPSKGQRRSFTVKLDLERATKLAEILKTLNIDGIAYLSPIIEAHLAAIDLNQLRDPLEEGPKVDLENTISSSSSSTVQRKLTQEEALRRAQTLAGKINLLLDAIPDEAGRPRDYPAIRAETKSVGYDLSRTRWSLLKAGKQQVVPDEALRAISAVFGVNPEYLLDEISPFPPEVEVVLPEIRIRRLSDVRDIAVRALGPVEPERLKAITRILDEAIHS